MGTRKNDTRTYTLESYRYMENGEWKYGYRGIPDDMSKEDIVTRFLYWLERKLNTALNNAFENTPTAKAMHQELDRLAAQNQKQYDELKQLYPEDMAKVEEEMSKKYDYLKYCK